MAQPTARIEAIVIKQTKLKETDLIITVLAADGTQHQLIAKGARKPRSPFCARVELANHVDLLIQAGKGNLAYLREAGLITKRNSISHDMITAAAASSLCQIAEILSREDAVDPSVFAMLNKALFLLDNPSLTMQAALILVAAFAFKATAKEGWRIHLDSCVSCFESLEGHQCYFDPVQGGIICDSCLNHDAENIRAIDRALIGWLQALIKLPFDELITADLDVKLAQTLLSLAHEWTRTQTLSRIKSLEFFAEISRKTSLLLDTKSPNQ